MKPLNGELDNRGLDGLSDSQLRQQISRLRKSKPSAPPPVAPRNRKEPTGDDLLDMTEDEQIAVYKQSPAYLQAQKTLKATPPPVPESKPAAPTSGPSTLQLVAKEGQTREQLLAELAMNPAVRAIFSLHKYSDHSLGTYDITTLTGLMHERVKKMHDGDLQQAETMLLSQAYVLDAVFHELLGRARTNMGTYLETSETYLRLAYRSQSQCRSTLETLGFIKNPKSVVFVRQANIANNQQINNNRSRAKKKKKDPNKLLEQTHAERLDARAPGAAKLDDSPVAALEAVDGTANRGGQG